ncbi:MAG: Hsp33 family molecular chaperone HslO [Clostridia bacterium]|nr:Hsp33 family molecular chaperone HslO [Clostridia bacterium]
MKKDNDILLQGLIGEDMAVYACDISRLVEEIRQTHDASPIATIILGRALAAAVMMCATLKNDTDRLTLMINGGGPVGNIIVVGNAELEMKAYVGDPGVDVPPGDKPGFNIAGAVGTDGFVTVSKDLGLREPYVGRTPLVSGEIGEDIAAYYLQSEQQPSVVFVNTWLETDMSVINAGGITIKPMPGCSEEMLTEIENRIGEISNFPMYLMSEDIDKVMDRIFAGMDLTILERRQPRLVCDCSKERFAGVLATLGPEELTKMIEEDGGTEIVCSFCNKKYNFDAGELEEIRSHASAPEQPSAGTEGEPNGG